MKHKNKKFIIHPLTFIFYFLTTALSDSKTALYALSFSAIHELGHYFSARVLGYRTEAFILYPFGAEMKLSGIASYKKDIAVAFSGPAFNLITAMIGYIFGLGDFFILYNLTLAALNLLPIKRLDGGSVLTAVLMMLSDPDRAERTVSAVSFIVLVILWIFSVYIFMMQGGSPSLLFICITLFASIFL